MMAVMDPFEGALTDTAQLADFYAAPEPRAWRKDIGRIDDAARRLIAATPLVLVGTVGASGLCDVSPRGGLAGFVTVLDESHVALPDATGNRRLDTLRNIVETGQAGLLFLIPGRDTTLRLNGPARVTASPDVLSRCTSVGKPPQTAIVVRAAELYTHCPKAFVRSRFWNPEAWPDPTELPTPAEVTLAHARDPDLTLTEIERLQADSLRHRLR
jgi:PPOX class probable FMN-dependent enzyme